MHTIINNAKPCQGNVDLIHLRRHRINFINLQKPGYITGGGAIVKPQCSTSMDRVNMLRKLRYHRNTENPPFFKVENQYVPVWSPCKPENCPYLLDVLELRRRGYIAQQKKKHCQHSKNLNSTQ